MKKGLLTLLSLGMLLALPACYKDKNETKPKKEMKNKDKKDKNHKMNDKKEKASKKDKKMKAPKNDAMNKSRML